MGLTREEIFILKTLHKQTSGGNKSSTGFITNILRKMGYDSDEVNVLFWLYINNKRSDGNYEEITDPDRRGNTFMLNISELGKKPWDEIDWKNADEWITDKAYPDTEEVSFDDRKEQIVFWLNTENLAQEFLELGDEGYYTILDAYATEPDSYFESDEQCYMPYGYAPGQLERFKDIYTYFGSELKVNQNGVIDDCQHDNFFRVIGAENYWDDFCESYYYEYKLGQHDGFSREVYRILEEAQIEEHGNMWAVVLSYDQFKELASTKQPEDWKEVFGGMFEDWRGTAALYDMSMYDFSPEDEEAMISEVDSFLDTIDEWIEENTDLKDSISKFNKIVKDLGLKQMYKGNNNYSFGKNEGVVIAGIKKVDMGNETVEIDIFSDKDARMPNRKVSANFDDIARWFTMPALISEALSPKFSDYIHKFIDKRGGAEYLESFSEYHGNGYAGLAKELGKHLGTSVEESLESVSNYIGGSLEFDQEIATMYDAELDFDSKSFYEYITYLITNNILPPYEELESDHVLSLFYMRWKYRKSDEKFWDDFHNIYWMNRESERNKYDDGPCMVTDDYGFYVDEWSDLAELFDTADYASQVLGQDSDFYYDYNHSLSEINLEYWGDEPLNVIKEHISQNYPDLLVWDDEQKDEVILSRDTIMEMSGHDIYDLLNDTNELDDVTYAVRHAYDQAAESDVEGQYWEHYTGEIKEIFGDPTWEKVGAPIKKPGKSKGKDEYYVPDRLYFQPGKELMVEIVLSQYVDYGQWETACSIIDIYKEYYGKISVYDRDFYPDPDDSLVAEILRDRIEWG